MTVSLVMLAAGCLEHRLETTTIHVDRIAVEVEVAETHAEREQGLMHRKHLDPDKGMLFVYADEKPRSFWMKNTRIPLTIAYADREGRIVKILDMEPYSEAHVQSIHPARYALEMNQGWFKEHDVLLGEHLTDLPKVKAE